MKIGSLSRHMKVSRAKKKGAGFHVKQGEM